jgi:predicted RNase H-like HicB family nuclease
VPRRIIVYQDENGDWCALCPSLGAFTQGESRDDALANMEDLLPSWIDEAFAGEAAPADDGQIEVVTVTVTAPRHG